MKKNIAIFPAASEIGLEINRALKYSTRLNVYGFSSMRDHTEYVYENYILDLPFIKDKNFIEELNKRIIEFKIDFIYPANDDVQLFLTENQKKIKARIITSQEETVEICRSKIKTYNYLKKENFIPKIFKDYSEIHEYPIFIKPDIGQGSKGAKIIKDEKELRNILENTTEKMVISEYLPGEEYTIDCFTDFKGQLRVTKMRNRKRIRLGISVNSEILKLDEEVLRIANIINNYFDFNGAWFFQLKIDSSGKYKLMEIAPRISGTMGISRNTGINYPLLTIFNQMKQEVEIIENNYEIEVDRAFINRYKLNLEYENVYLDLDDTLILKEKVNTFLIMFLYQCINKKKKIYLLTRHSKEVEKTLKKHKICEEIFEEIIHLKEEDKLKSNYIKENSIFIDDSFRERYDVMKKKNIPVFDVSEVESLIDWRKI